MTRRTGAAVSTTIAGLLCLAAALPAAATPTKTVPPSGDDRAISHVDNATTCAEAGLTGDIVQVSFSYNADKTKVTITSVPAGVQLTGVVVKGGDGYNVYLSSVLTALTGLRSPFNNGGQIPTISHWFACGVNKIATTTKTTITTTTPATNGGGGATSTTTPAAQGSVSGAELANTGFSATAPLVAGGALLLLGGGLLFLLRRTRQRS